MMQKIRAITSAFKAGWIAERCTTGCFADDASEQIFACPVHEAEIARLSEINRRAGA